MLVSTTLLYNIAEAVIALWSGAIADSIALIGFGLDSGIETAAATVLLYRLWVEYRGASPERVRYVEHRVHQFIGGTFIALALYVSGQSVWTLWTQAIPEESPIGIALAALSLTFMPAVAWGKLRAARELGSAALRAEAKETLACSYLSLALLLGLGANAWLGWWWADPAAAMAMVPWLIAEGREGLSGEECGCDDE